MQALLTLFVLLGLQSSNDLPIVPFPEENYGRWKATGKAFKWGPANPQAQVKLEITNGATDRVITSEMENDLPVGALTSPSFKITRDYISFRVGGGDYERDTCLNLIVSNKIVRSATGRRSDRLIPASWDVKRYFGQDARIEIIDNATGDWGHINVDRLLQTNTPEQLPVSQDPLYKESLRPQFHFTARQWTMDHLNPGMRQEGWVNDLNGLIYYEGEYHLFAQRWNKCWIHAVSKDLVHWTELEPAFWEKELDSGVQSGTCVIDYQNTSGLGKDKKHPPMIAFWSGNDNRSQCIHYSLDKGRTWTPYQGNPLLTFPERDPKVFWYEPGKHWVMMLYGDGKYHVLTSPNLLHWTDEKNPIDNCFECPDLFQLPLDGDKTKMQWVLIQGNGNYSLGSFDGKSFKETSGRRPCDVGPNFYATQTWENTSRRVQAAWMRGSDFPDMPFNQQVSFPCELTLRTTSAGPRLFREPVAEISKLHLREKSWRNQELHEGQIMLLEPSADLLRIKADLIIPAKSKLVFKLRGVPMTLTSKTVEAGSKPTEVLNEVQSVEILLDRASIETFVNKGEVSSTRFMLPKENGISISAEGGPITIRSLTVYRLKSSWGNMKKD